MHRLDRDTSGLLVVARTEEAHRRLQAALAERRIEREYLALVEGRPPARTGTIEAPIGRDPRVRTRMAVGGAGAREARTHFTLERALASTSLLRLRLDTGRTHQIRVHLQAIGHPVCGRPRVRHAPVCSGWSASSCTPRVSPSSIPSAASRSSCARRSREDLRAALERAETAILSVLKRNPRPVRSRIAALPGAATSRRLRVRVPRTAHQPEQ